MTDQKPAASTSDDQAATPPGDSRQEAGNASPAASPSSSPLRTIVLREYTDETAPTAKPTDQAVLANLLSAEPGKPEHPAMDTQKPLWGEREPGDPSYPVPHSDARSLPGVAGWSIVGASRRGKMHAHEGKYREDAWDVAVSDNRKWNIIAVADGGGSYALSRVGSRVAVESAVAALARTLPDRAFDPTEINRNMIDAMDAAYLNLEEHARTLAHERPGTTARDLSTTLLVVAHCPSEQIVCVAQVGDGLIALQKGNRDLVKLADADSGQVAGATVFVNNVTKRDWLRRIRQYKLTETPLLIAAMTDGVADDAVETENNFHMLFRALAEYTSRHDPEAALLEWLDYEKRGSFDDRTLVVIYPT